MAPPFRIQVLLNKSCHKRERSAHTHRHTQSNSSNKYFIVFFRSDGTLLPNAAVSADRWPLMTAPFTKFGGWCKQATKNGARDQGIVLMQPHDILNRAWVISVSTLIALFLLLPFLTVAISFSAQTRRPLIAVSPYSVGICFFFGSPYAEPRRELLEEKKTAKNMGRPRYRS